MGNILSAESTAINSEQNTLREEPTNLHTAMNGEKIEIVSSYLPAIYTYEDYLWYKELIADQFLQLRISDDGTFHFCPAVRCGFFLFEAIQQIYRDAATDYSEEVKCVSLQYAPLFIPEDLKATGFSKFRELLLSFPNVTCLKFITYYGQFLPASCCNCLLQLLSDPTVLARSNPITKLHLVVTRPRLYERCELANFLDTLSYHAQHVNELFIETEQLSLCDSILSVFYQNGVSTLESIHIKALEGFVPGLSLFSALAWDKVALGSTGNFPHLRELRAPAALGSRSLSRMVTAFSTNDTIEKVTLDRVEDGFGPIRWDANSKICQLVTLFGTPASHVSVLNIVLERVPSEEILDALVVATCSKHLKSVCLDLKEIEWSGMEERFSKRILASLKGFKGSIANYTLTGIDIPFYNFGHFLECKSYALLNRHGRQLIMDPSISKKALALAIQDLVIGVASNNEVCIPRNEDLRFKRKPSSVSMNALNIFFKEYDFSKLSNNLVVNR